MEEIAPRALLVTRHPPHRESLAALLGGEGYRVTTAADGEAVLPAISGEVPDLLFVDCTPSGGESHLLRELCALPALAFPVVCLVAAEGRTSEYPWAGLRLRLWYPPVTPFPGRAAAGGAGVELEEAWSFGTGACDFCGAATGPEGRFFSSGQMRRAVGAGLCSRDLDAAVRGERRGDEAPATPLPATAAQRDPAGWLLCAPCAEIVARFLVAEPAGAR